MSDFPDQGLSEHAGAAQAAGGGAGALIRRAREDAGLHIAALAVALKVPTKRLEALEAERYDLLPDLVFARALARSVCRHLKLDPEPVLARLPQGPARVLKVDGPINEPYRPNQQAPAGWPQVSRPALMAGGLLVLAALAVYVGPDLVHALFPAEAPAAAAPAPAVQGVPVPAEPQTVAPGSVVETVPSAAASAPAGAAAAPAASMPAAPAAPVPAPPATPAPATR